MLEMNANDRTDIDQARDQPYPQPYP
jgi:hypothetical protein